MLALWNNSPLVPYLHACTKSWPLFYIGFFYCHFSWWQIWMHPTPSPNSHTAMKLSSLVFFPCKNPRYNAKLAYRHPPRCQMIKWSIYCWLSLDIMPISYVTRQWFYRCLLFLQVGLQVIKVNWSSCINHLITVNCYIIKGWNHSVSFMVCELF